MMIVFVVTGLLLLLVGGGMLVNGAVGLARGWRVSPLVIGLTVVAFGTSAPELVVSLNAALSGHPDIVLGNVVGSNIANVLAMIGVAALFTPTLTSSVSRWWVVIVKRRYVVSGMYRLQKGVWASLFVAKSLCFQSRAKLSAWFRLAF